MITIEDCIALSELTEPEILAIAEHEHVPEMIAVEMGNYRCTVRVERHASRASSWTISGRPRSAVTSGTSPA